MTHASAERQNLSLQSLTDVWAGGVSALIFYAEYLGLGAALGESFFGRTPTAAANGTLLVLLMVVIGTMMAMCSRVVFLSGPRGASVAILGGLTLWLCRLFETSPAQRTAVVALLMAGAGLTVLCARHPRAQVILRTAPVWLIQGFLYATATSIVANAVASKLYGCLQVSEMMTWSIFLLTVILGVGWKPALVRAAIGRSFRAHRLLRLLHPLGLLVATGLSWWAYEATVLARAYDKRCRRLGDDSLDLGLPAEWLRHVGQVLSGGLPAGAALAALAAGCLLGLVLLIENVTTFEIDRRTLTVADRTRLLEVSAAMNLTAAVVGGSCISYSTSRTMVLRHLGGLGKLALLAHGGVVAAVALLASQWVAQVPGLTVAVTLTLVGAQMISGDAKTLWRKAYHPRASTPRLMAGAMFWVVLSLSLAVNSSLAGFLAGAFVMHGPCHCDAAARGFRQVLLNSVVFRRTAQGPCIAVTSIFAAQTASRRAWPTTAAEGIHSTWAMPGWVSWRWALLLRSTTDLGPCSSTAQYQVTGHEPMTSCEPLALHWCSW